jgi:hypothetical protein
MGDRERHGERTRVRKAPGMALARRRGGGHSAEVRRDVVGGRDGAGGGRQCQEGVMDEAGRGVALSVRGSGWGACPRGERLEASRSAVWRRYGAKEGMWGVWEPRTGVRGACHKLVCDTTMHRAHLNRSMLQECTGLAAPPPVNPSPSVAALHPSHTGSPSQALLNPVVRFVPHVPTVPCC